MSYANTPYPGNVNMASSSSILGSTDSEPRRHSSIAQTMVSSASALTGASFPTTSKENNQKNNNCSLDEMFQQTRQFYQNIEKSHEEERQVWNKEREGWQKERRKLLARIDQLESNLADLMRTESFPSTSAAGTAQSDNRFGNYSMSSFPSKETQDSSLRAIWQGPESIPTRTFSDSVVPKASKQIDQLVSIAEHPEHDGRKKSVGFNLAEPSGVTRHTSLAGVPGELIHPNYSGITLKSAALPPEIRKVAEEASIRLSPNRSPSPLSVTSPMKPLPIIRPKLLDIPTANMHSEDLYSADAGHTPLARVTGSEGTTGTLTPVKMEVERPPLAPRSTEAPARPPHERQDSYFVNAQVDGADDTDEDPALKEPLGVSSENTSSDVSFLDKVNEALEKNISEQAESSETLSPNEEVGHNRGLSEVDDFPKLRMKASSNFGAPFGESSNH